MLPTRRLTLALALIAFASAAHAQGRGPRGGGPPGAGGMPMMMGGDEDPVTFMIEHRPELALADSQVARLMDIRRTMRLRVAPFARHLDSLRAAAGFGGEPRRNAGSKEDREAMERFRERAAPAMDSLRAGHDAARAAAMLVLDASQQGKLHELEERRAKERREGGPRRGGERPRPGRQPQRG